MSRKCGTGEGGWVYLKGENSMVMFGLVYRKALVARGEYFFELIKRVLLPYCYYIQSIQNKSEYCSSVTSSEGPHTLY